MIPARPQTDFENRLFNWKFDSALKELPPDAPEELRDLVVALAEMYGNCGHFYGHMGVVVQAAINPYLPELPERFRRTS
jgi:hypothetical protein